jgi:hypothetical protein
MKQCKNCTHYEVSKNDHEKPLGSCLSEKWLIGYNYNAKELQQDQIVVEGDEGWGFLVMPEFGCIHHKEKIT